MTTLSIEELIKKREEKPMDLDLLYYNHDLQWDQEDEDEWTLTETL